MTARTLAVTGGTGFVGKSLIRLAAAQGWQVRALARSRQNAQEGVTWIAGALDRPDSLLELVQGSDAVIHVAGVVNAPDRAAFEAGNVFGTIAMVEAAKQAGVERFIHVSSLAAREPDLSDYGWSKAKAEQVVAASGLDWTMVRPPWVYGPGDLDTLDLFKIARSGFLVMPPLGKTSVIEVSDLARLLLALIPDDNARAEIYEPDDGEAEAWTNASFGRAIGWSLDKRVSILHMPRWLMEFAAKGDRLFRGRKAKLTADRVSYMCHPDWTVDPAKRPPPSIWQPQVKTRAGLKTTARAYRDAGLM